MMSVIVSTLPLLDTTTAVGGMRLGLFALVLNNGGKSLLTTSLGLETKSGCCSTLVSERTAYAVL